MVVSGVNRWSIALVNRRTTDALVNLAISGAGAVTLSRFIYSPDTQPKDATGFPVPTDQVSGNLGSGVLIAAPPNSVVVVTNMPQSTNIDDSMAGCGLNRWSFVGTWGVNNAALTNEYNRSTTYSNDTNDTASVTFYGTGLNLYAHRGTGGGDAAISVDGGAETAVSFYNATTDGNVKVWGTTGLSAGQHTVRVRVAGTHVAESTDTYVAVDRLEVLN